MEVSVEDLEALRQACIILTTNDSATDDITAVTQQLQQYQQMHPNEYSLSMLHLLQHDNSLSIRAIAAIFLRTHLTQADQDTYVVEEQVQSHIQNSLFECLKNEEVPYVSRNLVDTIASVGAIAHGFKQWTDLVPQTLTLAKSELERHRYAAVDLLGRLYTNIGHQLEEYAGEVFQFLSSAVAEDSVPISSMAVVSACRAVVAMEDLEARVHYQSLVPRFLEAIVRALQSDHEHEAKMMLSAMVDLVFCHSDANFFKKYPKMIAQVMNDIATSEELTPAIRQFALELLVNLILYGQDVFSKHKKFVETTLTIIFSFISTVSLELDFNLSPLTSFEEETANSMYTMGIDSFARITQPLGKRVIRQLVVPVLSQMLTSYANDYKTWANGNPRAAADRTGQIIPDIDCSGAITAIAALVQIVDDRHQIQIFKLNIVTQFIVNPCHPRLRSFAISLFSQIFMNYPVSIRTDLHAKVIPPTLDVLACQSEFMRSRHVALACIGDFLYECPESLSSIYADNVVKTIIPLLDDPNTPAATKETIFDVLGRMSDACPQVFADYHSVIIPVLQRYVMEPQTEKDLELRPSALGALTHIGQTLDDAFIGHAQELLDFFINHNAAFLDGFTIGDISKDKQRSELSLLQSLARLWNIIPEDFSRCLSLVFPIIINNIIQLPTESEEVAPVRLESGFTVESLRETLRFSTDQFKRAAKSLNFESAVDDDNPIEKLRSTSEQMFDLLEDKVLAINLFTDMPLTLGRHFAPYAEIAAIVLGHIIATVNHDDVVHNSLFGYPRLVKCVADELQHIATEGGDASETVALLERVTAECIDNIILAMHSQEGGETISHCILVLHSIFQTLSEVSMGISVEEGDTLYSGTGLDANGEAVALGLSPRYPPIKHLFLSQELFERVVKELRSFANMYLRTLAKQRETLLQIANRETALEQIAASAGIQLQDVEEADDDEDEGESKVIEEEDSHTLLDPKRKTDFRNASDFAKEREKLARVASSAAEIESSMLDLLQSVGEALNTICIVAGSYAYALLQDWLPELLTWLSMDVAAEQRGFPLQIMRALIPHASNECIEAGFLPQLVTQCLECIKDLRHTSVCDNSAYIIGLVAEFCTPVFESDTDFMKKTVSVLCELLESTKQYIAERQEVYEAAASDDTEVARAAAEHIIATRANKKREAKELHDDDDDDFDDDDDDDDFEEMDEIKSLYYVVDNIVCTLGRFVFYCQETSVFNLWLSNLPVREDNAEGEKTYRILYAMTQQNPDLVSYENYSNLPTLLTLWATVYTNVENRRSLRLLAANMLVYLSTSATEAVHASLQTLSDELVTLVASALESAPNGVAEVE